MGQTNTSADDDGEADGERDGSAVRVVDAERDGEREEDALGVHEDDEERETVGMEAGVAVCGGERDDSGGDAERVVDVVQVVVAEVVVFWGSAVGSSGKRRRTWRSILGRSGGEGARRAARD